MTAEERRLVNSTVKGWLGAALVATASYSADPAVAAPVARFDYVQYRAERPEPPLLEGQYRNPILPGFQPDPSIVRVGKDFYLVNSTFAWFPGLPVYHSTDLVNWRQIGNAIDRAGMLDMSRDLTNRGLFAPAISYHDGQFLIVNTCIDCGGNFVITARDPAGPWSQPHWLKFGGIDPSLFFDTDGTAWVAYNDAPPGEPAYEGHRAIWLRRFDLSAMQVTGDPILLVNGGVDIAQKPVWAEGPHIYKVGETYYLTAAEGGTADQHSQTVYRADRVTGPYRPGPRNPILTQRDLPADRHDRVEATGHADWVVLDDGSWWGVFLATRPFAGQSTLMGRETFLLPLEWIDGWPRFLAPGEPVPLVSQSPQLPSSRADLEQDWRDEFTSRLGFEWISLRTPGTRQRVAMDDAHGELLLVPGPVSAGQLGELAFVGRRLRHNQASYETKLQFDPQRTGDFAGLLAFADETHFVAVGIEPGAITVRMRTSSDDALEGKQVAAAVRVGQGPVQLRMSINGGRARFEWRDDSNPNWTMIVENLDVEPLSSIHAGLFTGLVVGPYAVSGQS